MNWLNGYGIGLLTGIVVTFGLVWAHMAWADRRGRRAAVAEPDGGHRTWMQTETIKKAGRR